MMITMKIMIMKRMKSRSEDEEPGSDRGGFCWGAIYPGNLENSCGPIRRGLAGKTESATVSRSMSVLK